MTEPKKPRSHHLNPQHALESFAPELLTLLERGSLERIVIPADTAPSGPNDTRPLEERQIAALKLLRHSAARLNQLRSALVKTNEERGKRLYKTHVMVDEHNLCLIVEPRDGEIVKLIRAAKIDTTPDMSGLDELDSALKNEE